MIILNREEAQQVLDALKNCRATGELDEQAWNLATQTIETLRARLSAPEPEPVACKQCGAKGIHACIGYRWEEGRIPPSVTFTAPSQREWQGLTRGDADSLRVSYTKNGVVQVDAMLMRVDEMLRERNT